MVLSLRTKKIISFLLFHILSPGFDGFISIHLANTDCVWYGALCQLLAMLSPYCHRALGVEGKCGQGSWQVQCHVLEEDLGAHGTIDEGAFPLTFPSTTQPPKQRLCGQRWVSLLGSLGNIPGFFQRTWLCKPLRSEITFLRISHVIRKQF